MLPQKASRRAGKALAIPSSLLMFVCAFLPAVRGCEDAPVYPYQEATKSLAASSLGIPYVYALLCLAAVLLFVRGPQRAPGVAVRVFHSISALACVALSFMFVGMAKDANATSRVFALVMFGPYLWLMHKKWQGRRLHDDAARAARIVWTGSAIAGIWFLSWIVTTRPMYGMWLSLLSAIALSTSGVLIEVGTDLPTKNEPSQG